MNKFKEFTSKDQFNADYRNGNTLKKYFDKDSNIRQMGNLFCPVSNSFIFQYSELFGLKEQLGFNYVHKLLSHHGKELNVLQLMEEARELAISAEDIAPPTMTPNEEYFKLLRKKATLKKETAKARREKDQYRVDDLIEEMMLVEEYLKYCDKSYYEVDDWYKRQSDRMSKAIRSAIKSFYDHDVELARHMEDSIKTGYNFSYLPNTPKSWTLFLPGYVGF
jgi:hypothetical protein